MTTQHSAPSKSTFVREEHYPTPTPPDVNATDAKLDKILSVLSAIQAQLADIRARLVTLPTFDLAKLDVRIEDLDLSVRAENCLKNANISVVGQLVQYTPKELRRWRNVGSLTLREYETALARFGLRLGMISGELGGWEWTR